jgi:hypothetical protein
MWIYNRMRFADSKDIKRAQDLGKHSGAVHSSKTDIARGKASSMAKAITDRRKILGRLEAIADVWAHDYETIEPFIDRCIMLWPNSQYSEAAAKGRIIGEFLFKNISRAGLGIGRSTLIKKYSLTQPSGTLFIGEPYEFDEVARIIFNTMLERSISW